LFFDVDINIFATFNEKYSWYGGLA